MPSDRALRIAARIWCDPEMKELVMDINEAKRIAYIIDTVIMTQECQNDPDKDPENK